jgi:hypothetical protein
MTDVPADQPARYANGRFGPGNPGRPLGSYSRASRRAAMAILEHFETHQEALLDRLVNRNSELYCKVLGRVLPRQIEVGIADAATWTEAEAARAYVQARAVLITGDSDRRATMVKLESILLDGGADGPGDRK